VCVLKMDEDCSGILCPTKPQCTPSKIYENPCVFGTPLMDENGNAKICVGNRSCPSGYNCTMIPNTDQSLCCISEAPELTNTSMSEFYYDWYFHCDNMKIPRKLYYANNVGSRENKIIMKLWNRWMHNWIIDNNIKILRKLYHANDI